MARTDVHREMKDHARRRRSDGSRSPGRPVDSVRVAGRELERVLDSFDRALDKLGQARVPAARP